MGRIQTEETKRKIIETRIKNNLNDGMYKNRWDEIIYFYKSGKTIKTISEIIGCSNVPIRNALKKSGTYIRGHGAKYIINDYFFDNIDSEIKSYWLGMIATDGTIRKDSNRNEIVLSLKVEDVEHIGKFLRDIGSSSKIYYVTRGKSKQAYASVCSGQLKNALIKLGITPNKSLTLKCPIIDKKLERHFWRGAVDGDGCLRKATNGNYYSISMNGTLDIINGYIKFLRRNGIISPNPLSRGNIFSVGHGGRNVFLIAKLLYENSNVFLNRKEKIAQEIIKRYKDKYASC